MQAVLARRSGSRTWLSEQDLQDESEWRETYSVWLFRTYDIGVAPHCPLGPIAFAASLQIGFSTSNFLICEMSWKVSRQLMRRRRREAANGTTLNVIDALQRRRLRPFHLSR